MLTFLRLQSPDRCAVAKPAAFPAAAAPASVADSWSALTAAPAAEPADHGAAVSSQLAAAASPSAASHRPCASGWIRLALPTP